MNDIQFENDLNALIEILPPKIKRQIKPEDLTDAIEIVLDIGRIPEIRLGNGKILSLGNDNITREDLDFIVEKLPEFTSDNRSGIPGTLHRISAIRNRQGKIVGLTCRIGRVVTGTINCIKDIVLQNPTKEVISFVNVYSEIKYKKSYFIENDIVMKIEEKL